MLRVTHERVDVREVISSVVKSEARSAEKRRHDLRFEARVEVPPVCGDEVAITVGDNGRGILPEDMPILFDKFHRGRPARHSEAMRDATTDADLLEDADVSGVGLGLYLARNVMEQMGGHITVESEVGQGSTFKMHLPVWRAGGCNNRSIEERDDVKTVVGR